MHKVIVNFSEEIKLETSVEGNTNLLQELDSKNLMIARGCMAGSCGVCRMEVLSGIDNFLPAGVVEQDTIDSFDPTKQWRLACCAQLNGDVEVLAEQGS